MIIIRRNEENQKINIVKGTSISVINGNLQLADVGYTPQEIVTITDTINDKINYTKQIEKEYNDTTTFNSNYNLLFCPNIDTSNRTSCSDLFYNCFSLMYLPPLTITNKCNSIRGMFYGCTSLPKIDVSNWDISNCTSLYNLFSNCQSLKEIVGIENFDTSNVTDFGYSFYDCQTLMGDLDLSNWNTEKITNLYGMYYNCKNITKLDLSTWNTSKVYNISSLFANCSSLVSLNLSGWDLSNVTQSYNASSVFSNCTSLTNFIAPQNISVNVYFSSCNNLTVDSLMSIINNLKDKSSTTSITICELGSVNLAKLTDEQKAIATSKNWVLR